MGQSEATVKVEIMGLDRLEEITERVVSALGGADALEVVGGLCEMSGWQERVERAEAELAEVKEQLKWATDRLQRYDISPEEAAKLTGRVNRAEAESKERLKRIRELEGRLGELEEEASVLDPNAKVRLLHLSSDEELSKRSRGQLIRLIRELERDVIQRGRMLEKAELHAFKWVAQRLEEKADERAIAESKGPGSLVRMAAPHLTPQAHRQAAKLVRSLAPKDTEEKG